jgi:hypothetical protein
VVKRIALLIVLERVDPPFTVFGEFEITMTAEELLRDASRSVAIKRSPETRCVAGWRDLLMINTYGSKARGSRPMRFSLKILRRLMLADA